ncbi:MAG: thymidylate kinase [Candidatus Liptonbacteria bacterium]|nr:thymidylate kinase [Candidatus Liptonbacteria bacterium]
MEGTKGKFIVIEGTDGSGKTEQFNRLILDLPETKQIATLDFPRYGEPSSYFVQQYLRGRYGSDVGPYTASIFFALDRFDTKLQLSKWLEDGRIVVANRYVASSMGHQGAKIDKKSDREKFFKWLYEFEYGQMGIPRPDLNIILHVPAEVSYELIAKKASRDYLKGKSRDIHESNFAFQKRSEEIYLEIAGLFPEDFAVVECVEGGKLLSIDEIHRRVLEKVAPLLGT